MTTEEVRTIISAHIPSLSDEDEQMILDSMFGMDTDVADLAKRTCACGQAIDGYYDYVDHLIALFGGVTFYGG